MMCSVITQKSDFFSQETNPLSWNGKVGKEKNWEVVGTSTTPRPSFSMAALFTNIERKFFCHSGVFHICVSIYVVLCFNAQAIL